MVRVINKIPLNKLPKKSCMRDILREVKGVYELFSHKHVMINSILLLDLDVLCQ